MIIADEDDTQKLKDSPVAVPTVRYPARAASRRPFSPLPDYETSQALAFGGLNDSQVTPYKTSRRRRFVDSRLWRVAIVSLIVYIFLTLAVGVPLIIHVRSLPAFNPIFPHLQRRKKTRTGRNTPTTYSLMPCLGQAKTLPRNLATPQVVTNQEYMSVVTGQPLSILTVPIPPSSWLCTSFCPLALHLSLIPFGRFTGLNAPFPRTDSSASLRTHPASMTSTLFRVPFTPASTPTRAFKTLSSQL